MTQKTRLKRRAPRYIQKVEGELRSIYRNARDLSDPNYEVVPADFIEIKNAAKRALEALGWEVTDAKPGTERAANPSE